MQTRTLQNASIPATRLPSEILSEIFIWRRNWHIQTTHMHGASSILGNSLTRVAHACHSWREAALATPRLWCCVDLGLGDAAFEYIRRACHVPLELLVRYDWDADHVPSQRAIDAVCAHPGKIVSLTLRGLISSLDDCLSSIALCSSDTLRVLQIVGVNADLQYDFDGSLPALSFPRMEVLVLDTCVFDWKSNLLSDCTRSLRRLLVNNCASTRYINENSRESQPVEMPAMVDILSSFRGLEVLILTDSFPGCTRIDGIPELSLLCLHYLYLRHSPAVTRTVCRALRIPDACRADVCMRAVSISFNSEVIQDVSALFLPQALRALHLHALPNSLLIRVLGRTLHISGVEWTPDIHRLNTLSTFLTDRAAHLYLRIDREPPEAALWALCGGPEAIATQLTLHCLSPVVAKSMADATGFLPNLKSVSFEDFDMEAMKECDVQKWVEALVQRRKGGARVGVNFQGCHAAPNELVRRLEG